ncbi:flagellar brake protein [Vibrio sp. ZSDE26]|uniref:Flagellar brake protein n=1 Tax=Vibrio amylolyticus TaxID=2847292 RepID=A0A9X2BHU3_9VIBR|nr:flagellar brake protein [Vibrio amylolyticus]MCK6264321.1 flagellar brake protein [Vibrio amylolyticus]
MDSPTAEASEQKKRARNSNPVSTINSTDALAIIEHGSELTIAITTPIGRTFQCSTPFIGTHENNLILIELPKVSNEDLSFFFQEGFWLLVKAISPRGEGAVINFRCQLIHFIHEPIAMIALSIPSTMQIKQLRKESRYDVNILGKVITNSNRGDCEIRDLSKSGCRFVTPPLSRAFQVGDRVSIEIRDTARNKQDFAPLTGTICNLQRSLHYARYGLQFNESGQDNAKALLGQLKYNGTKLTFK